ncbi:MAG TPA: NAD(P)/FAD-dependent oxidoreductase [Actinomycetota bacterium]
MARPKVLVLGGGYAGVMAAAGLGGRADVLIVSRDNFLLFTPMLAEVAAGDLDPRHVVSPIRQLAPHARLLIGDIEEIDLGSKTVAVRPKLRRGVVRYRADAIVLGLGAVQATFGIEGVDEHALPFKTISDALRIRNRMLASLEAAAESHDPRLTKVAVVGAGYSGAELATALADMLSEAAARFYRTAPRPHVTLVDALERVTAMLPERLSAEAERGIRDRGIEPVLGAKVAKVHEGGISLEDGREIEAGTVIWAAGVRPNPLVETLGLPTGPGGRLVVDEHLQAVPGVFAGGDLAAVPDGRGGISPPTAQFALRQGVYLGRHLSDVLEGRSAPPFRYRTLGELVSLGHRNAVGLVFGVPVTGVPAWFLWRSYYLMRLPTLLRKARVALDWTLDVVFPPDIAWLPTSDLGPDPSEP